MKTKTHKKTTKKVAQQYSIRKTWTELIFEAIRKESVLTVAHVTD